MNVSVWFEDLPQKLHIDLEFLPDCLAIIKFLITVLVYYFNINIVLEWSLHGKLITGT